MREQELFDLIRQCETQKGHVANFIEDAQEQYPHAVGPDRMKLRNQVTKYRKRKSKLSVKIIHAKTQLLQKGHNVEI